MDADERKYGFHLRILAFIRGGMDLDLNKA